jgi:hypothetical protein
MDHRIHEGILYQDKYKRYCLHESDLASAQNADLYLRLPTGSLAQSNLDRLPMSKAMEKITGSSLILGEDFFCLSA